MHSRRESIRYTLTSAANEAATPGTPSRLVEQPASAAPVRECGALATTPIQTKGVLARDRTLRGSSIGGTRPKHLHLAKVALSDYRSRSPPHADIMPRVCSGPHGACESAGVLSSYVRKSILVVPRSQLPRLLIGLVTALTLAVLPANSPNSVSASRRSVAAGLAPRAARHGGARLGLDTVPALDARAEVASKWAVLGSPEVEKSVAASVPPSTSTSTSRARPGAVATSHFVRSLTGTVRDGARMYAIGEQDGLANRANAYAMVLLDIGGQVSGGIRQSVNGRFVSYPRLVSAIGAYLSGYALRMNPHAVSVVAVGTNNDLKTDGRTGAEWATRVVNPLRERAGAAPNLQVMGADDIEPGFSSGLPAARRWLLGYLHATSAPLIYNGSADGCSPARMASSCHAGWTATDIAWLAGLAAPNRILALPQIYTKVMVGQWEQIARTAVVYGGHPLHILGPLTETAACGSDPDCPTMPSRTAWLALWHGLRSSPLTSVATLPVQTDLNIS